MTTVVDFQPSGTAPFQFQATLDGDHYIVTVPSNAFGERYYVQVSDLSGNLVVYRAIVSSTAKIQAAFSWANGTAMAVLSSPHNVPIGAVARVTVSDTDGLYDGTFLALATSSTVLTFPMATDPGATASGSTSQDVNLVAGYFSTSSLVWRDNTGQFEISP